MSDTQQIVLLRKQITDLLRRVWMEKIRRRALQIAYPNHNLTGCPAGTALLHCLNRSLNDAQLGRLPNAEIEDLIHRLEKAREMLQFAATSITKTRSKRQLRYNQTAQIWGDAPLFAKPVQSTVGRH